MEMKQFFLFLLKISPYEFSGQDLKLLYFGTSSHVMLPVKTGFVCISAMLVCLQLKYFCGFAAACNGLLLTGVFCLFI